MTSKIETTKKNTNTATAVDVVTPIGKQALVLTTEERAASTALANSGISHVIAPRCTIVVAAEQKDEAAKIITNFLPSTYRVISTEEAASEFGMEVDASALTTKIEDVLDTVVIGKYSITATTKSSRRKLRKFAKKDGKLSLKRMKLELKVEAALAAVPEPVTFNDRAAIEKKFSRKRIKLAKKQDKLDAKLAKHINKDLTKTIKAAASKGE